MKRNKTYKNSLIVTLVPGVVLIVLSLVIGISVYYQTSEVAFADKFFLPDIDLTKKEANLFPVRIVIPKIFVDLTIRPAEVLDGTWITYEDSASFGIGSAFPNKDTGNTVIFAHARTNLFARLDELSNGDAVYLLDENSWREFRVYKKLYVFPEETSFLNDDFGKSLIMFTCYGQSDEKRVVVIAKYYSFGY